MIDLDELERVANEATPGDWQLQDGCSWRRIGTRGHDGNVLCPYITQTDRHPDLTAGRGEDLYANLHHIATFDPPTVLSLIARIRELEGREAALTAEIERLRKAATALVNAVMDDDHLRHCGYDTDAIKAANDLRAALAGEVV